MTPEKDDGFAVLKRYIEQTLKIQCSNYKEDYIKRRLLSRMHSAGHRRNEYLGYLREHPPELENLRNALTINVTEFFRDADVYNPLRNPFDLQVLNPAPGPAMSADLIASVNGTPPQPVVSENDAARFLEQATFGATDADITMFR